VLWGFFVTAKSDIEYMQRALDLAGRARGETAPNPMVGAVIVRGSRVVGEGYHRRAGKAHAEIEALRRAGQNAKGADLYVTLEPCCHWGRTGPCTDAIIEAGIKRVIVATSDPNPKVKGKGIRALRSAGIEVVNGVLRDQARRLNEVYLNWARNQRPFVTLKLAQSLDGRIATATGDSQWISCAASRKRAHQLRAENDAVMVGMGTVRSDNPSLTVRHVKGRNPYRIVVTASADLPRSCHLLTDNSDVKTIVATSGAGAERLTRRAGKCQLTIWEIDHDPDGLLRLSDLLSKAGGFGIQSVLVEGGSRLATSLLEEQLVNKFIAFVAPRVVGTGRDAIDDLEIRRIANAIEFKPFEFVPSGKDVMFTGYPKRRG
jgi:diaminohydroxyphosphoribosylaminopyrimidine deaminase/5-amino-6-(5-phosphoribosylamino)uracil reductase